MILGQLSSVRCDQEGSECVISLPPVQLAPWGSAKLDVTACSKPSAAPAEQQSLSAEPAFTSSVSLATIALLASQSKASTRAACLPLASSSAAVSNSNCKRGFRDIHGA